MPESPLQVDLPPSPEIQRLVGLTTIGNSSSQAVLVMVLTSASCSKVMMRCRMRYVSWLMSPIYVSGLSMIILVFHYLKTNFSFQWANRWPIWIKYSMPGVSC